MGLSNYLEVAFLDHIANNAPWTAPTTIYWGLSTTSMMNDEAPTEPVGNNYSRVSKVNADFWGPAAPLVNAQVLTFPQASGAWGNCMYLFASDAASGGNIQYSIPISPSLNVINGDTPSFGVGIISLGAD